MERLTPSQREMIAVYLRELEFWNHRLNLTSVPPEASWSRHVEEALRLAAAIGLAPDESLIDVGSGTGVPGLVLAITRRETRTVLLEADARKAGFLTHVAGLLGLAHAEVVNERAERAGHDPALRQAFDAAVSRAAAPPATLCELALPFVRRGGRLGALVTDAAAAAAAAAGAARACGGDAPLAATPTVLLVRKTHATPEGLPRRTGVPARDPLV